MLIGRLPLISVQPERAKSAPFPGSVNPSASYIMISAILKQSCTTQSVFTRKSIHSFMLQREMDNKTIIIFITIKIVESASMNYLLRQLYPMG